MFVARLFTLPSCAGIKARRLAYVPSLAYEPSLTFLLRVQPSLRAILDLPVCPGIKARLAYVSSPAYEPSLTFLLRAILGLPVCPGIKARLAYVSSLACEPFLTFLSVLGSRQGWLLHPRPTVPPSIFPARAGALLPSTPADLDAQVGPTRRFDGEQPYASAPARGWRVESKRLLHDEPPFASPHSPPRQDRCAVAPPTDLEARSDPNGFSMMMRNHEPEQPCGPASKQCFRSCAQTSGYVLGGSARYMSRPMRGAASGHLRKPLEAGVLAVRALYVAATSEEARQLLAGGQAGRQAGEQAAVSVSREGPERCSGTKECGCHQCGWCLKGPFLGGHYRCGPTFVRARRHEVSPHAPFHLAMTSSPSAVVHMMRLFATREERDAPKALPVPRPSVHPSGT
eukprot:363362-Chlamydomonas_euryale.AAC.14